MSKAFPALTLPHLFKITQLQQCFMQRRIKLRQDVVLNDFLDFIMTKGLETQIRTLALRVVLDEKKAGQHEKRSAKWLTERKIGISTCSLPKYSAL